jgi:predicted ATPase/class 3 adenylate cyclase
MPRQGPADGSLSRVVQAFLIADIRGYTAYTAAHGDEAGTRLTTLFATIAAEAAQAYSGRLVEASGDEVLCAFDDPVAALAAAVELQDAFADELAADPALPLRAGVGVAAGSAVPLGTGFRGSTLNLAARLCSLSAAGEVHASAGLVERVGKVEGLGFEAIEGLELKGLASERRAFRVRSQVLGKHHAPVALSPLPGPVVCLPPELDTSVVMVGREAEMRWLGWHWRRARHGHPRTVLVEGLAGVGKTRLVAELAATAQADAAAIRYSAFAATDVGRIGRSTAVGPGPMLTIVDGVTGGAWARDVLVPAQDHGAPRLTIVVRPTDEAGRQAADGAFADLPRLQVQPLSLSGVRALAMMLAPSEADELPIARILETSQGLPGPARAAVLEWSERIAAERVAGHGIGSLPAEASSFVGRIHELDGLRSLLNRARLLTLTGPPGIGKTRLATQLARAAVDDFDDGTYFVPLASLRDEKLVGSAIAHALQLRESTDAPPFEVVKTYVAQREVLLVLDNFEHLAAAAPEVGALLAAAPRVKIIVTSRATLGVSGEQVYRVPSLSVPPVDGAADIGTVAACDAATLFVLRAQAADPEFDLRPDNAAAVSTIVTLLEGLPLAIELAAARIRMLEPNELLEQLGRRLPLLVGGAVDHAQRQQTMRDAIAWSYELLGEDEQDVLRRLSVFRGGFTINAAAHVVERSELETLDLADRLLAKSLLYRTERHQRGRLAMLELIREFARDELVRRREQEAAFARHTAVYLAIVREKEPLFEGPAPEEAREGLTVEIDNLRAALERAGASGDAESSLRLAACPWRFWQSIGQLTEGRAWLERALALPGGSILARATAIAALGGVSYWQGDFSTARDCYRRARDLYAAVGDKSAETNAVYSLSLVATYEGQLDAAERYAEEAMELARGGGHESMVAEVMAAQSLVAWKKRDLGRATALGEAALEIARRLGLSAITMTQLVGLAGVAYQQGHTDEALRRAGEALELAIEAGNTHTQIFALDSIASFSVTRAPVEAVRLCEAAAVLNAAHGGGWTLEVMGVPSASSVARNMLQQEVLDSEREAGAGLDLSAAVETARSLVARSGTSAG